MYRPTKLGGPGIVVEIDESKFGRRKYHKARTIWIEPGTWSGPVWDTVPRFGLIWSGWSWCGSVEPFGLMWPDFSSCGPVGVDVARLELMWPGWG
ncbi:hypothetical protein QE152_g26115 [Popillia japonica]|uniref:Uncharacterized protein n=1 Tax=Popillia japonica TaxID=7064 RepID=A0AAW1JZQ0_POPJA